MNINKKTGNLSIISEHRLEENHDFEWETVEILEESFYYKRLLAELIHIKKQTYDLNKQSDTEKFSYFPNIYLPIGRYILSSKLTEEGMIHFCVLSTIYM